MYATVIAGKNVVRINAKSVQELTQALHAAGIRFTGLHVDDDEKTAE